MVSLCTPSTPRCGRGRADRGQEACRHERGTRVGQKGVSLLLVRARSAGWACRTGAMCPSSPPRSPWAARTKPAGNPPARLRTTAPTPVVPPRHRPPRPQHPGEVNSDRACRVAYDPPHWHSSFGRDLDANDTRLGTAEGPIHRSAWNRNSTKFVLTEFHEVRVLLLCCETHTALAHIILSRRGVGCNR